jgi:negative regulator of flagellin synthesis FlgM
MRVGQQPASSTGAGSEVASAKNTDRAAAAAKAKANASPASPTPSDSSGAVKADLSARGKEMASAKRVADQAPDVREEKIAELKRRIAAGRYEVNPDKIADKMVDDHMKSGIG